MISTNGMFLKENTMWAGQARGADLGGAGRGGEIPCMKFSQTDKR